MLSDEQRYQLRYGPYQTPQIPRGSVVPCARRGEVQIVGMTDAPIPWPTGKSARKTTIVLCGDLVRAVQRESNVAVAYWWGVSGQTVTAWRKALGVGPQTEGSTALQRAQFLPRVAAMHALAAPTLQSPERRQKIAEARRGKPRPKHVHEALRRANAGRKASEDQRRKQSAAHKRRGTRPPAAGAAWTAAEDALLSTLSPKAVAEQTGRTVMAVYLRRRKLGLPREKPDGISESP